MYSDENIALVPGTDLPINVNNINHLTNSGFYVDNETPTPGTYTQYDGHTVAITLRKKVVPDTTYILKIGIADASDPIYDSGVFIKAHSFCSGEFIGIEKIAEDDLIIYPVPADNLLQIKSSSGQNIESLSITDQLGRIVLNQSIQSTNSIIDVHQLTPGIYLVTITTSKGSIVKKIIVQ